MRPINWIRVMMRLDKMFWAAEETCQIVPVKELRPMLHVLTEEMRHADRLYMPTEEWETEVRNAAIIDDIVQVDADATISEGDEDGAYVQAWVWVSFSDVRTTAATMRDSNMGAHNARSRS